MIRWTLSLSLPTPPLSVSLWKTSVSSSYDQEDIDGITLQSSSLCLCLSLGRRIVVSRFRERKKQWVAAPILISFASPTSEPATSPATSDRRFHIHFYTCMYVCTRYLVHTYILKITAEISEIRWFLWFLIARNRKKKVKTPFWQSQGW
jgi:hypothetical protein